LQVCNYVSISQLGEWLGSCIVAWLVHCGLQLVTRGSGCLARLRRRVVRCRTPCLSLPAHPLVSSPSTHPPNP
jgi:hypothetical protein